MFGWGQAFRRLANLPPLAAPITVGLGLAAVVTIGGLLNLARLAYAPALWVLFVSGFALAAPSLWRWRPRRLDADILLAGVLIASAVGFAIVTQLPPGIVNHFDDLEKYLVHPVRMLQTGTLLGSPLSALGSETLGGAAFLHGFVASLWPIAYVNGVDAVFGLGWLLALAALAGRGAGALPGATLMVLAVASIEPQSINVSPLYLGAGLMATAVLLTMDRSQPLPAPAALGLLYAALVALKPTFLLFAVLHLGLAALAAPRAPRDVLAWAGRTGAVAAAALAPWLLLHLPHYANLGAVRFSSPGDGAPEPLGLLSPRSLLYGASMAHYAALAALGAGLAAWGAWAGRAAGGGVLVAGAAGALAWLVLVPLLAPWLSAYEHNTRYSTPFLLGTIPFAVAAALTLGQSRDSARRPAIVALMLAGLALAFAPSMLGRYRAALESRSTLAYLRSQPIDFAAYRNYFRYALSAERGAAARALQQRIPAGEPVLVWSGLTFHLDFTRNPIVDAEPAGLATNWAVFPANVRYAIWQYAGATWRSEEHYANWVLSPGARERRLAVASRAFAAHLAESRRRGEILHDDGQVVVLRLPAGP